MSRMRLVKLIVAIQAKPHSIAELHDICGFTPENVRLMLHAMQREGYADVMGWGPPTNGKGGAPMLWGWRT